MGMFELTNAVIPVTGQFVTKRTRVETVSCSHCDYVLAVIINDCGNRTYESDHTCRHCGFVLCKHCWEVYCRNGNKCEPLAMRIDFHLKYGRWPAKGEAGWEQKVFTAGGG